MADQAETHAVLERETTLVICSDDPEKIEDEIASLTFYGGFCLRHRDALTIRDAYFDTRSGSLGKSGRSLRIRQIDRSRFITLKGRARSTDWGGLERTELELPWCEKAWTSVLSQIPPAALPHPDHTEEADRSDPLKAIAAAGLKAIQHRTTQRRPRDVQADANSPIIAELVIDTVDYEFATTRIRHSEVEIEAKAPCGTQAIEKMASALLERYGPALRPWSIGKLATGLAVERLLADGLLDGMIQNGRLSPQIYEQLYRVIVHRARGGSAPGEDGGGDHLPLQASPIVIPRGCA